MDKPYGRCYWVSPGKLLAGVYPGAPHRDETEVKLSALLTAGIQLFADLTESGEHNWAGVALAPYDEPLRELADARGVPVQHRRFAVPDQGIPPLEEMRKILDGIDASIGEDRPVYVHCWGGKGRTGTVVGCWLIRHGLATTDNFVDVIAALRRHDTGGGRAPENVLQDQFVRDYATWEKKE